MVAHLEEQVDLQVRRMHLRNILEFFEYIGTLFDLDFLLSVVQ